MNIAVLAVQGAFTEHEKVLNALGINFIELRQKEDLKENLDGLILPGGESTVQGKLLRELDMLEPLKERIQNGLPVLATCAGLILLAEQISNDEHTYFSTLPVTVKRNAYGRQLGSFYTESKMRGIGTVPMEFIRAPYIESARDSTTVLAEVKGNIVAVQYKNQIAMSFHPELCSDDRIHRYFLEQIIGQNENAYA